MYAEVAMPQERSVLRIVGWIVLVCVLISERIGASRTLEALLSEARQFREQGKFSQIVVLLGSVDAAQVEGSAGWHNLLGYAYYKLGRYENSIQEMQTAIRLDPTKEDFYLDLGELFLEHHASKAAIALFDVATRRLPHSEKLQFSLALSLDMQHRRNEAIDLLKALLEKNPSLSEAVHLLGSAMDATLDFDGMLHFMQYIRQRVPSSSWAWHYEAWARFELYRQSGYHKPALEKALSAALRLNPSAAESHFLLGKWRAEQGHLRDAISALRKSAELDPTNPTVRYQLGQVYRRIGEYALSDKEFAIRRKLLKEQRETERKTLMIEVH